ncbi:MAG: FtsX-like permease family protein [Opitutaceae bacterium]
MAEGRGSPALAGLLWWRFTCRHWIRSPGQTVLLVLIVALGVAVYSSVRLANRAAVSSFQNFTETVTGQSDWILEPRAGDLDENVLVRIRTALGPLAVDIIPVVESTAAFPRSQSDGFLGRTSLQLVGLDLIAAGNLFDGRNRPPRFFAPAEARLPEPEQAGTAPGTESPSPDFWSLFRESGRAWLSPALARRENLAPGDRFELVIADSIRSVTMAAVIPVAEGYPKPDDNLILFDLPDLQTLTGRTGRIDRVEFRVASGPGLEVRRETVRKALVDLGEGLWSVESPANRRETGEIMTRAFRMNLTVLSLIALAVGLLLILQSLDGAVVRRRQEIAILRSLGVTGSAIRRAWLLEALSIGAVGGVLGALLGWAGAQLTVRLVGRTVDALYYATSVDAARPVFSDHFVSILLGVMAGLVAGWLPANEATRVPPAQSLGRGHIPSGLRFFSRTPLGGILLAIGFLLLWVPPLSDGAGNRFPLAGYAAAFFWILGAAILSGAFIRPVARLLTPLVRENLRARLALSHLTRPSSRHRLATAGLVVAVGMTAGMIILIGSFEKTVVGWIGRSLQADLYLASDGAQNTSTKNRIAASTWQAILNDPAVADGDVFLAHPIVLENRPTLLGGFGFDFLDRHQVLPWIVSPRRPRDASAVPGLISESFSVRFEVGVGDFLEVPGGLSFHRVEVVGLYADYGNERGTVLVDRHILAEWLDDDRAANITVFLKPGEDPAAVRDRWSGLHPGLRILTHGNLREEILRIFRQTFSITYALELIGLVVAVAGLGLTLASILIDRRESLTTLRALGMNHREIARSSAWEGFVLAMVGSAGGLILSLGLGWILIHIINKQTFGWTLMFSTPWWSIAALTAAVLLSATLTALAVGRWSAALPADREE